MKLIAVIPINGEEHSDKTLAVDVLRLLLAVVGPHHPGTLPDEERHTVAISGNQLYVWRRDP